MHGGFLRSDLNIIIGHGHGHVRAGIRQLLVEEGITGTIREAATVEELTGALGEGHWDIVVLGTSFANTGVRDQLATIRRADPDIRSIVLSNYPHAAVSALLLGCGADAVVLEERIDDDLLSTIEKLRRGEYGSGRGHEEDSTRLKAAVGERPSVSALSSKDRLPNTNLPKHTIPPASR